MPAIRADTMFRAFADHTRLRILSLLRQGETCVGDLVGVLGSRQPKVSRHLAYLRRSGLVECENDGTWCYYRLAAPTSELHARLLDCLTACPDNVPELRTDERSMKRLRKSGGCCTRTESAHYPATRSRCG